MSGFTQIDLLRHGEPEGGQKFRGSVDDPLSTQGWEQMRAAVGAYQQWQAIISSPLVRCAAFAADLSAQLQIPLDVTPGFREIGFGDWEGRAVAEVHAQEPVALGRFWRDPLTYPIPGGEPLREFDQRISHAWTELLATYQGQDVLVVTHGGVIRVILRQFLDMPLQRIWRLQAPFASLTRLRFYDDPAAEPHLVFHNGCLP